MTNESDNGDKQYEPSQKRLDDARKKGEIPKSTDLTAAAAYGGLVLAAVSLGASSLIGVGSALKVLLDQADSLSQVVLTGAPQPVVGGILGTVIAQMVPWFALPAAFALLSVLAQGAFVVAPTKISPKLSRISLIQGFKNKFGRQGLFEFAKSFAKLTIYAVVLGLYVAARSEEMVAAMALSPAMVTVELGRLTLTLMLFVLGISGTLGAIDLLWQRAEHRRKHRMTRQELIDETKESEGDPTQKQKRRQKGIEIAMNQMLADVADANVIIVNPTHYAVALSWAGTAGSAPVCVAKGVDEIAARIREIAAEHAVPIHSDPPTARALHATVEIGSEIPPVHYQAVAAAIRFADLVRRKMAGVR